MSRCKVCNQYHCLIHCRTCGTILQKSIKGSQMLLTCKVCATVWNVKEIRR